ncbi:MAG TPA: hypothetical protein VFF53_13115 [Geobacteraceae bacterium]|nr:hypothetical protein [Geobacteraceae bacterium]
MLVFVPVFLGLISLGVRLPTLVGYVKSGPKPRPRALIQNQIKSCKEKIDKTCQELAPDSFRCQPQSPRHLVAPSPLFTRALPENNHRGTATSRAPPVHS